MTKKEQRAELLKQINKVIDLHLKIERTYTDLTRTRDEEDKRRDFYERRLCTAETQMLSLIKDL